MMQQLFDAGIGTDPVSGMAIFNPSACAPAPLAALWRAYCGVADTINTKELGQTEEALEELKSRLLEHAAQITETDRALTRAKRSRLSPTPSASDEVSDADISRKKRVIEDDDDDE